MYPRAPLAAGALALASLAAPGAAHATDLAVQGFSATVAGGRVTYDVTVCNRTPYTTAPPAVVQLFLDARKRPACGSGAEDAAATVAVAWGSCAALTLTLTLPAGDYRSWVLADGTCALSDDDRRNNARAVTVKVRPGEADLYVRRFTATPRDTVTRFTAEICSGAVAAREVAVRLWPSLDDTPGCGSRGAWGTLRGVVPAGGCTTVDATVGNLKPGVRTARLMVDATCRVSERDETNNVATVRYTNGTPPRDIIDWVDPFIGTGGDGETFPGPSMPFGMIQPGPDTRLDANVGYKDGDRTIIGFSHTRMSGVGRTEMRDFLLMPAVGASVPLVPGSAAAPASGYRSRFRKDSEQASPGYYRVLLADYNVAVELTATRRAALHRYTFPATRDARVIVDLLHPKGDPLVTDARLTIAGDRELTATRVTRGWAPERKLYFYARFSRPFTAYELALDDAVVGGVVRAAGASYPRTLRGKNVKARLHFATRAGERILVKVGFSGVSEAQAKKNALAEIPGWGFDATRAAAEAAWRRALSAIKVTGGTPEQRRIFYTALYHALLGPLLFMDVDGRYLGLDGKVHVAKGFENYTAFSLWDTFRALHPLLNLIQPRRTVDFVKSLLARYDEGKVLPRWPIHANYTWEMIGNHAVSVIADAYLKGIRGFDASRALAAMKATVDRSHPLLAAYRTRGWVTYEADPEESVSRTLEYAFDDWALSRMAAALGGAADAARYAARARAYRNLYDKGTGFMRPRHADGRWVTPFDSETWIPPNGFTEADAWQYLWFVPHDVPGLMALMGGPAAFIAGLDAFFTQESPLPDTPGVYGRNYIGNQPAQHTPYLYVFAGQPEKTQALMRHIMRDLFRDHPQGLPGNDDVGQISAWYVFGAMGFYPVTPASNLYILGSPIFRRVEIALGGGKRFVVSAPRSTSRNVFVNGATLNGKRITRAYLRHAEIAAGGTLRLEMADAPTFTLGAAKKDWPR